MPPHLLPTVWLKAGRDKKIRNRYPWVQREEVVKADACQPGDVARLVTNDGQFLAIGTYNVQSRFPFRVLALKEGPIDHAFFKARFVAARARRSDIAGTNAVRELFAEADGLPGLIVDRYADVLVVQVRGMGMERLKPVWLPAMIEVYQPRAIYEKSEMEGRREEGLESFAGALHGDIPENLVIEEAGLKFEVPIVEGLKTGFYLDQRDARRRLAERVKPGDRVLDAFCYTGAFSVSAAKAGAETHGIDLNPMAIECARRNAKLNGLGLVFEEANAFEWLETEKKNVKPFDWMVLDPPAIAKSKEKRDSLKWGIWKLVSQGVDLLKPGGRMIVCSCSYQLSLADLADVVRLAASDRGRQAFLEEITIQSPDHPYLIQFPESLYLKSVWVRMEG